MAVNFDVFANNARSVLRGEAVGSVRFLVLALLAFGVWVPFLPCIQWTEMNIRVHSCPFVVPSYLFQRK